MPSKISDLQTQKKNPKRINIFLDGKFAFSISLESKIVNHLKIDQELTQTKIDELIFADQVERLYDKSLRLLGSRPRSEREIRNYLLQKLKLSDKGENEQKNFERSIEEVIKKLIKIGQISDREFASWWVEQRTRFKKSSPRVIKQELLQKGVNKEIIDEIFSEISINPLELAMEVGRKKKKNYEKYEPKIFREKMGRHLASKGFGWEVIKKAVDTLIEKE